MKGIVIDMQTGDLLVRQYNSGKSIDACAELSNVEEQVVEHVLAAQRGEFKELPLIGGEVRSLLGGERDVLWPNRVKSMIKACGVDVSKITIAEDNTITVE